MPIILTPLHILQICEWFIVSNTATEIHLTIDPIKPTLSNVWKRWVLINYPTRDRIPLLVLMLEVCPDSLNILQTGYGLGPLLGEDGEIPGHDASFDGLEGGVFQFGGEID